MIGTVKVRAWIEGKLVVRDGLDGGFGEGRRLKWSVRVSFLGREPTEHQGRDGNGCI